MPFTRDGIKPDMIINPHAIPTRMTIGQLVETIMGKACVGLGGFGDGTPFINKGSKIGVFGELLPKLGFHSSGNELLYDGMSGEQIESEIFVGPVYYMRLKHMVKDKINYRALGPRTALTKQPVSGRANDGGLRIGEMERDSVAAHGITDFLTESMMERGDKYYMAVCNKTGLLAIYNPAKNLFFSPMADGPIRYIGSLDGKEMHIENITKYGRDFSVVCIPYSMKLLIQELQAANIQMRIITEDNLPQLEGMSFSKNIDNLLGINASVENLTKNIQNRIRDNKLIDLGAIQAANMQLPPTPEEEPWQILSEDVIEKLPENIPGEESPPYTLPDTPPEIRAELEAREKANKQAESEVKGGNNIEPREYQLDDLVLYRGDPTKSYWRVIDITPSFITIENVLVDDRTLPPIILGGAPDNRIEIVRPNELYQWQDIPQPKVGGNNEIQQPPYINTNTTQQNTIPNPLYNGGAAATHQPNINFQPVINLVGGDNKGTIEVPTSNPIPNHFASMEPISEPVTTIIGGGNNNTADNKEDIKQTNEEKKGETVGGVNFSNLVIKKMNE